MEIGVVDGQLETSIQVTFYYQNKMELRHLEQWLLTRDYSASQALTGHNFGSHNV